MPFVVATRYLCSTSLQLHHKLPKRIILLRHGESLGNVDENSYANVPDWKIPLTRRGERQALKAAEDLFKLCKGESVFIYSSPYTRAWETWQIMNDYLQERSEDIQLIGTRQEPRLAEQQFGNFQVNTTKREASENSVELLERLL
jgi:broad specificity phosphatase PhoE